METNRFIRSSQTQSLYSFTYSVSPELQVVRQDDHVGPIGYDHACSHTRLTETAVNSNSLCTRQFETIYQNEISLQYRNTDCNK